MYKLVVNKIILSTLIFISVLTLCACGNGMNTTNQEPVSEEYEELASGEETSKTTDTYLERETEINDDMQEIYKQVIEGDLTAFSRLENYDSIVDAYKISKNLDNIEWKLIDIDHNGYEELVWQEKEDVAHGKRIVGLFSLEKEPKCIIWDLNDSTEFFFISNTDKLVYCTSYFGTHDFIELDSYTLNVNMDLEYIYGLHMYNIYDISEIGEKYFEALQDNNPDMEKEGVYYRKFVPQENKQGSTKEILTEEQFLEEFAELTGIDFFEYYKSITGVDLHVFMEEENANLQDNETWADRLTEQDEGKKRTNGQIEVSVERVSKPITNDDGQILATVYYERPVVSGDSETAKKINQFFEQEERDWFGDRASRLTLYNEDYFSDFKEGVETICELYEDEETLVNWMRYAVDTWIVLLDDDLLSVVQITNVYVAHCNWHYFGTTFDLETGDLVSIDSLINITPEKMKKIIEDTSEPVTETYDELKDDNYIIHYYGTEVAMNYEYFYDGKNYFIIINRGDERFVDGEVIEWNGKWGDEYEMAFFRYWVDSENGRLMMMNLM